MQMNSRIWPVFASAALGVLAALGVARAADPKPLDEGKAEEFKGKSYDLDEKAKTSVVLAFPAGKEVVITVKGVKKTDVHLFVYDAAGKEVAKDDSPGPDCEVKLTPKEAGKYTLEIRNLGPGATSAALKVDFAKPADK
jgi:hypothetical protein